MNNVKGDRVILCNTHILYTSGQTIREVSKRLICNVTHVTRIQRPRHLLMFLTFLKDTCFKILKFQTNSPPYPH